MNPYVKVEVPFPLYEVKLVGAGEEVLERVSSEMGLALNLEEMKSIREHFTALNRDPTDVELQTIGQTWSEHCFHKTFKGEIILERGEKISSLFKAFIARATEELDPPWCISVFEDNAGIIAFEGDYGVAVKVETHNHPSAIEPFGGAATGTGGVIRDILGVWADPIACTDVLCFGPLNYDYDRLPPGVKHPRYIFKGVVAGIGHYGNNMGIPTVNGAVYFDESYTGNVVVYCGCIGLLPLRRFRKETRPGDIAVLVGGRTGRDGIHGVTFASTVLTEESEEESRPAVQIPNPIEEEKLSRALRQVRDEDLCSGVTDLGGGGLSSAVGETAHRFNLGVDIHLDRVPLKYSGLTPWEIWISESQERMLLTIPGENLDRVLEAFREEEVEATPIGAFNSTGRLRLYYRGYRVGELDVKFLFSPPRVRRRAAWRKPRYGGDGVPPEPRDLGEILESMLAMPNIASREDIVRTYDHEVKGNTVLKPLHGERGGPSDAAVLKPLDDSWRGLVISCGMNPLYGKLDPYWMAASAIDEALRNNTAVGGRRIALLDNFTWGNPERLEQLGSLVRACKACYRFAKGFRTPFISGKDSLYNESPIGPVTPTLLITAIGITPDVRRVVSLDLKSPGDSVYIVGATYEELGGSHYYVLRGVFDGEVPRVRMDVARRTMAALVRAIDSGCVRACHDPSEGGLAVAAAEMAFTGNLGLEMDLRLVPASQGPWRDDLLMFSESNSRFIVEVDKGCEGAFRACLGSVPHARVGVVSSDPVFSVKGLRGQSIVSVDLDRLYRSWRRGLKDWSR
ncbi:MAG: phosphoribosylformylglycinamidine synthase subunit PurL [Candidatus Bathyarchaeia archaeon]